jgi:SAM-dependent methyltransferase
MKVKPFAKGLLTFIPGMARAPSPRAPRGTSSAEDSAYYSYGVWIKHLTLLWANGMSSIPNTFAELGPGESLGVGLAAMLCGTNTYYALDVVRHSNAELNLRVLDELVTLFKARAERSDAGWPDLHEYLGDNLFPSQILSRDVLEVSLSDNRIAAIRTAIGSDGLETDGVTVKYAVPWYENAVIERDTIDVICSHSVMEHIVDLEGTYRSLYSWLKPQGIMSHQIDLSSHEIADTWNGHWAFSELQWKIMVGRRPYLLNREPHSVHTRLMAESGFSIVCDLERYGRGGIQRSDLSARWKGMSDDDFACSIAFIQAKK